MQLSLQNFSSLVQTMAAGVQAASRQLLDLRVGSVLRAVLEANASVALWMQWLILQVLQTARATTSTGADLDSWMADFALTRLPAGFAGGTVTFSRFTPLARAVIPVGSLVRTADGSQTFAVTANLNNPNFSAVSNGYVLAANAPSLDAPVVAQTAGAAGNVLAGTVSLLATAIPGIDSVANAAPFGNGVDAEADGAFRSRFANYLNSRSRATLLAIGYAISSIQQGLLYTILENSDPGGRWRPGSFVVTVDDGTGFPSDALISTVAAAVENVRPVGSIYTVQRPVVVTATISLAIAVTDASQKGAAISAVSNAIAFYINALPIGASLPITRLAQVAYAAHPSVSNVSQLSINGASSDLAVTATGVIKAGVVGVS